MCVSWKYGDVLMGLISQAQEMQTSSEMWVGSATNTHTHTQLFCCINCSDSTEHKAEIGHLGQQTQAVWSAAAAEGENGLLEFF